MGSVARKKFDENCGDVRRLLEIHGDIAGDAPGRKYGVEVLNKSAVVLITAFWEGYCEDIAAEGLAHLVAECQDASSLPKELKKRVAAELSGNKDELAIWTLAGDGWRTALTDRLERLREERNRRLNTPKATQIDELFLSTVGIPSISKSWYWKGMSTDQAREKLDRYVTLRGSIAHRGAGAGSVRKTEVTDYFAHVRTLVSKTGGKVNGHVKVATGVKLF
jgi:hypothetical protein